MYSLNSFSLILQCISNFQCNSILLIPPSKIVGKYQIAKNDTGSPEVQIALMTDRIAYLTEHFKTNAKDHHSRRGLLALVSQRRKLLDYLRRQNLEKISTIA